MKIIVKSKKKQIETQATEDIKRKPCGHRDSDTCMVHACCACYIRGLSKAWYSADGKNNMQQTGGSAMAKMKKAVTKAAVKAEKKSKRITAASILIDQFGLEKVKSDEALIELVKEKTGSKKFDKHQLAWYKSAYRAGKLGGMNGKAGHVIDQGNLVKKAKVVKTVKKATKKTEEPIEE